jgi:hypothetical protein
MITTVLFIDGSEAFATRVASRLAMVSGDGYATRVLAIDAADAETLAAVAPTIDIAVVPHTWTSHPNARWLRDRVPCLVWGEDIDPFSGAHALDDLIRATLRAPDDAGPWAANTVGTHLSFSPDVAVRTSHHVLHEAHAHGRAVVYVPVQPLYAMRVPFQRGPGATVGDLLCRIAAGDLPSPDTLGTWLYHHEHGYYTFRMPERADDLIAADTELLRQWIHLVKAYVHDRSEPMMAWIDVWGLPLDKHLALADLCDFIYIDAPTAATDAAAVARRELGLFLAQLPPSCDILEWPGHAAVGGERSSDASDV